MGVSKERAQLYIGLAGAGLILFVVVAIALFGKSPERPTAQPSTSTDPTSYVPSTPTYSPEDYLDSAVNTCQKAVRKGLKDPDSAKFGDDWKAWRITSPNASPPPGITFNPAAGDRYFNATGAVNAKNGFGAYMGDEPYYCDVVINAAGNVDAVSHDAADLLTPPTP